MSLAENISAPPQLDFDMPGFWRVCISLILSGFCAFSALYCVQPILPVLAADFGIGAASSSLAMTLTTIALAVGLVFSGPISDSLGRKPVMLFSMVSTGLLMIALAFAPSWHVLLVIRTLIGLLLGGITAINLTYLAEEVTPHSLGRAVGLVLAGNSVGGMISRVGVGVAAEHMDWHYPVAAVGVLSLIAAALLWLWLPASRHFTPARLSLAQTLENYRLHLHTPGLPSAFLAGFLLMGAFVTFFNYIGFRLLGAPFHLGQTAVGLVSLVFLPATYAAILAGRMSDRYGAQKAHLASIAVMALGLALTAAPVFPVLAAGTLLFTMGFFGAHSTATGYVARTAHSARAQATSMYQISFYVGASIAGTLGGLGWDLLGWSGVLALLALLIAAAFVNGRNLHSRHRF
ncbi:MFS transporter [Paenirhodobacter populi]|uniref:MFS transporter n=1 Tax=Paenirhodobacter populi TaxID=2306993 RepID=UPI000FE36534|nr:MFS transporter [Sinirhodobacter populi]RWR09757.1 MFS transporter [Sinirhodobacter populi]